MKISRLIGTAFITYLALFTSYASAALTDISSDDWLAPGDGLITRDSRTGLEWLDLTYTASRSYYDVSVKLGVGQEFDGWRYATTAEVGGFWDTFGGTPPYDGSSAANNGLFKTIAPYWGDLWCAIPYAGCQAGEGNSTAITADSPGVGLRIGSFMSGNNVNDIFDLYNSVIMELYEFDQYGSALVRATAVPLPAAAWLFGAGILGIIGTAKRKARS